GVKWRSSPKPTARNAAVTVRRPQVRSAPATSVSAWAKVGQVKATAKGRKMCSSKGHGRTDLMRHLLARSAAMLFPTSHLLHTRAKVESNVRETPSLDTYPRQASVGRLDGGF